MFDQKNQRKNIIALLVSILFFVAGLLAIMIYSELFVSNATKSKIVYKISIPKKFSKEILSISRNSCKGKDPCWTGCVKRVGETKLVPIYKFQETLKAVQRKNNLVYDISSLVIGSYYERNVLRKAERAFKHKYPVVGSKSDIEDLSVFFRKDLGTNKLYMCEWHRR